MSVNHFTICVGRNTHVELNDPEEGDEEEVEGYEEAKGTPHV